MKSEDIKTAAIKINDLERVAQIIKDLDEGQAFTVVVGQNNVNLPADKDTAPVVRAAIIAYLKDASHGLELELGRMGVEGDEEFDATLAALEDEAQPANGAPN